VRQSTPEPLALLTPINGEAAIKRKNGSRMGNTQT